MRCHVFIFIYFFSRKIQTPLFEYAPKNIEREVDEEECDFVEEGQKGDRAECWLSDGYWMSKCIEHREPALK